MATLIPNLALALLPSLVAAGLGLIVGSAITAAVPQLQNRDARFFFGRSICPACGATLGARDLMPVLSFLISRGHCRHCDEIIPAHYPTTELAAAASFGLVTFTLGTGNLPLLVWHLFFVAIVLFLAVYDWQFGEIPDEVSLPAAGLAIAGSFFFFTQNWYDAVLGAAVGASFFLLLVAASRGRWMGGGDIRLGLLVGAWLGFPLVIVAVLAAAAIGSVVGGGLQLLGFLSKKAAVPFAPLLFFGAIVALVWGNQIISWYLGFVF